MLCLNHYIYSEKWKLTSETCLQKLLVEHSTICVTVEYICTNSVVTVSTINSYSASHDNWCTGTLWNRVITAQCEGMGEVGLARHEPALLPPCPSIRALCYSNCQRSTQIASHLLLKAMRTFWESFHNQSITRTSCRHKAIMNYMFQ